MTGLTCNVGVVHLASLLNRLSPLKAVRNEKIGGNYEYESRCYGSRPQGVSVVDSESEVAVASAAG